MTKRHEFWVELRKTDAFKFSSASDAKAFHADPKLDFSFDPEHSDDSNKKLKIKLEGEQPSASDFVVVETQRQRDVVIVQYRVMFKVSVGSKYTEDDFDVWAENDGGWSCAFCEPVEYECEPAEFAGDTYLGSKDEYGFSFNENGDAKPAKSKVDWPF